jgi:outer membrane protein assembly factor BamB
VTSGVETSGVAIANGVVYFKPTFDPNLYAIRATDGTRLAAVQIGGSNSGVSVSGGQVFVGLGNIYAGGGPGGIVALGLTN